MKTYFAKKAFTEAEGAWLVFIGMQVGFGRYWTAAILILIGAPVLGAVRAWSERS